MATRKKAAPKKVTPKKAAPKAAAKKTAPTPEPVAELPSYLSAGMQHVNDAIEAQTASRNKDFIPEFFIKAGDDPVIIQVVDSEPTNAGTHSVKRTSKKGKPYWVNKTCMGPGCLYCSQSGSDSPVGNETFKSNLTILDSRVSKMGTENESVDVFWARKLYRLTPTRMQALGQQRGVRKHGLAGAIIQVTRTGSGQSTAYSFEFIDREEFAEEQEFADLREQGEDWDMANDMYAPCGNLPDDEEMGPLDYAEILKPDTPEQAGSFLSISQETTDDTDTVEPDEEAEEESDDFGVDC